VGAHHDGGGPFAPVFGQPHVMCRGSLQWVRSPRAAMSSRARASLSVAALVVMTPPALKPMGTPLGLRISASGGVTRSRSL
jgi:hypothetical protein